MKLTAATFTLGVILLAVYCTPKDSSRVLDNNSKEDELPYQMLSMAYLQKDDKEIAKLPYSATRKKINDFETQLKSLGSAEKDSRVAGMIVIHLMKHFVNSLEYINTKDEALRKIACSELDSAITQYKTYSNEYVHINTKDYLSVFKKNYYINFESLGQICQSKIVKDDLKCKINYDLLSNDSPSSLIVGNNLNNDGSDITKSMNKILLDDEAVRNKRYPKRARIDELANIIDSNFIETEEHIIIHVDIPSGVYTYEDLFSWFFRNYKLSDFQRKVVINSLLKHNIDKLNSKSLSSYPVSERTEKEKIRRENIRDIKLYDLVNLTEFTLYNPAAMNLVLYDPKQGSYIHLGSSNVTFKNINRVTIN